MAVHQVHPANGEPLGVSPEQAAAVLAELDAILISSAFTGSKRCQDFLQFIVKCAIAEDYENLTERFLGAELFGRPVDYETATDSIVRVRASDVRRRLAQYYSERSSSSAVIIGLPSGSYVPDFQWHVPANPAVPSAVASGLLPVASQADTGSAPGRAARFGSRNVTRLSLAALVLLLVAAVLATIWTRRPAPANRALEGFWQPITQGKGVVTFCFGDNYTYWVNADLRAPIEQGQKPFVVQPGQIRESRADSASAGNIRAALSIAGLLTGHGVSSQFRWPQEVQEAELDRGNVVFIAAFSNSWTMRLNRDLRFSFEQVDTPRGTIWMVRDRQQPGQKWALSKTYPQPLDHDYAIITRIIDNDRKRVVISVGGLNQFGTQAAGEFLADEASLSAFARMAPKGWEKRNLQIVLEMGVSQNRVIDPRIVAINVW